MKIKIDRPPYKELWNCEFPRVVLRTITIAGKYDTDAMHLGKSFGELESFAPQLEDMNVVERKNAKNAARNALDRERDILITAAKNVTAAFGRVELPSIKPYFEVLDTLFAKHKVSTMASAGMTSETQRLFMLEKDIASNSVASEAIATLGIGTVMERLFAANKEFDELFHEIIAEKGAEEKIDVRVLRESCTKALGQFFDAIQYCAFAHEDIDYMPLINEINKLNTYYIQQLKARATRRKNGKKIEEEEPIVMPEE